MSWSVVIDAAWEALVPVVDDRVLDACEDAGRVLDACEDAEGCADLPGLLDRAMTYHGDERMAFCLALADSVYRRAGRLERVSK